MHRFMITTEEHVHRPRWRCAARRVSTFALRLAGVVATVALSASCIAQMDDDPQTLGSDEQELSSASCPPKIPESLAVPAGNRLGFALEGRGNQIYGCGLSANGYAWALVAPDADLFARNGRLAGSHYGGPTWEALDGSTVVAARVAAATVDPTAIPWLLLQATSHTGDGRMAKVSFIQRIETEGGLAPSDACDASTAGQQREVGYRALYRFFVPVRQEH